ncbi:hypothetical protein QE152_g40824 [Popillia japonica]|uniref:Uncharacterized protein n=1 Tax=Popillia japonica TaxID=7064 RepID=A0AAW1HF99_POPJA
MGDKSDDGSKPGVRKKEFLNKQRSNSLESTNFSQSEINKIIGIETTKKSRRNKDRYRKNPVAKRRHIENRYTDEYSTCHVAKHCNNEVCCHKCGENHDSRECPESQNLNCPNCKKLRLPERKHSARDPKCPAYLQKLNKQKQYINYTYNTTDQFLLKG